MRLSGYSLSLFYLTAASIKVSAALPSASDLDSSYTFDDYIADFEKEYDDEEYQKRKDIFENHLNEILRHNEAYFRKDDSNRPLYFQHVNHLTDLEHHEMNLGFDKMKIGGWSNLSTAASRKLFTNVYKHQLELPFTCDDISTLPKEKNWKKEHPNVVTPVKNQGGCGSCWTFASVTALETQIAIKKNKLEVLSEEEILSCAPNPDNCGGSGGCGGGTAEIAYEYVSTHGIHDINTVPYEGKSDIAVCPEEKEVSLRGTLNDSVVGTMEGFAVLPNNDEKCLMNAVVKHGSVVIAVDASTWGSYSGGIFDKPNPPNIDIDHAVTLEGYGTEDGVDYWLVRNSWGPNWGENGYIRIKRTTDCGFDSTPLDGISCKYKRDGEIKPVNPVKICGISGVQFHSVIPIV